MINTSGRILVNAALKIMKQFAKGVFTFCSAQLIVPWGKDDLNVKRTH